MEVAIFMSQKSDIYTRRWGQAAFQFPYLPASPDSPANWMTCRSSMGPPTPNQTNERLDARWIQSPFSTGHRELSN